jgi:hypothetical protein
LNGDYLVVAVEYFKHALKNRPWSRAPALARIDAKYLLDDMQL